MESTKVLKQTKQSLLGYHFTIEQFEDGAYWVATYKFNPAIKQSELYSASDKIAEYKNAEMLFNSQRGVLPIIK